MARTKRFYQYDAQGNTRALSDSSGTVTDTFTYSAFGKEIARTGTTKTPFRWNGRVGYYWDADTQTYQVRRRPFRPTTARWLTVDPIGFLDAVNLYSSVGNNPENYVDPSGAVTISRPKNVSLKGNPRPTLKKAVGGARYEFEWQQGDLPTLAQRVTLSGTFSVALATGLTHSVSWDEDYVEAWVRGRDITQSEFTDNHLASPRKPALYIENATGCRFILRNSGKLVLQNRAGNRTEVEAWSFTMNATFQMDNGNYNNWPVRLKQRDDFGGAVSLGNGFRITGLTVNGSTTAPIKSSNFASMLRPSSAKPLGIPLPGFPPQQVRKSWVSMDLWRITWEEGQGQRTANYQGGYKPNAGQ